MHCTVTPGNAARPVVVDCYSLNYLKDFVNNSAIAFFAGS